MTLDHFVGALILCLVAPALFTVVAVMTLKRLGLIPFPVRYVYRETHASKSEPEVIDSKFTVGFVRKE